jgi:hypothetical protein
MPRGITDGQAEYAEYLASPEWRVRRDRAVARAEGRCQLCNSAKHLNVHHRTYARIGRERPTDLIVLCRECHEHFHGITGGEKRRLSAAPEQKPRRQRQASANELAAEFGPLEPSVRRAVKTIVIRHREFTIKNLRPLVPNRGKREIQSVLKKMVSAGELRETAPGYWCRALREPKLIDSARPAKNPYKAEQEARRRQAKEEFEAETVIKPWDKHALRAREHGTTKRR